MGHYEDFVAHFEPLYGAEPGPGDLMQEDRRWQCLKPIAKALFQAGRPVLIVETGTMRAFPAYRSDGNMTMVWDWIARVTGGECLTIDIDPRASACAQEHTTHTTTCTGDSALALRQLVFEKPIDLLFLDSYDLPPGTEDMPDEDEKKAWNARQDFQRQALNSMIHQVAELTNIWERLPDGCLIASDDCALGIAGKSGLTKGLLQLLTGDPVVQGYISVWQKKPMRIKS